MDFCIYSNIKKQVCETTGISPSEIFSSNNEEVVDARYLLIHLLCDKFTDKEIANMTGISKSLANKIRIHVTKIWEIIKLFKYLKKIILLSLKKRESWFNSSQKLKT